MNLRQVIYPPCCVYCGKYLLSHYEDYRICPDCLPGALLEQDSVRQLKPSLRCVMAADYSKVRQAVLSFKFRQQTVNARTFGYLMALAWRRNEAAEKPDAITWVPVSFLRKYIRGYDQAYLLAKYTAKQLNLPLVPTLKRIRHTKTQSHLTSDSERLSNVREAFICRRIPEGCRHVLLVDDIVTSGATLCAAASALEKSGIQCTALCFANARMSESISIGSTQMPPREQQAENMQ